MTEDGEGLVSRVNYYYDPVLGKLFAFATEDQVVIKQTHIKEISCESNQKIISV